jgi:hypothetical protein
VARQTKAEWESEQRDRDRANQRWLAIITGIFFVLNGGITACTTYMNNRQRQDNVETRKQYQVLRAQLDTQQRQLDAIQTAAHFRIGSKDGKAQANTAFDPRETYPTYPNIKAQKVDGGYLLESPDGFQKFLDDATMEKLRGH